MFGTLRRLFTGEQAEVTELFPAQEVKVSTNEKGEIEIAISASEIPTVRTADTSEASFTPVITNPLDWESQPADETK